MTPFRVKIYGAGSIGNHLANASRALNWDVTVCDVSDAALDRMKTDIYPSRYGAWDSTIHMFNNNNAPRGQFDLIIIGTPPVYHIPLALEALQENPQAILIEKPLCGPTLEGMQALADNAKTAQTKIFVGYTHVVSRSLKKAEDIIASGEIGEVVTLDAEFREHWGGIFKAHPWLKGPEDSYLGFWEAGGGASGEHSHALNLWQHLAHVCQRGRVSQVVASLSYQKSGKAHYDDLCFLHLRTEQGFLGRVVQDVVTTPSKKWARIQGTKGTVEWVANIDAEGDGVIVYRPGQKEERFHFPKKRADDFIAELQHLHVHLQKGAPVSPLCLERGLDSMMVLCAAHLSQQKGCQVTIDATKGYTKDAFYEHAIV